jgi:hypothetical protein
VARFAAREGLDMIPGLKQSWNRAMEALVRPNAVETDAIDLAQQVLPIANKPPRAVREPARLQVVA